jgi:hypothetical protein
MRRSRFCSILAAGALAFGAMTLTTTAANAIPESTIKSQCEDPDLGGTYTHFPESGLSQCCYKEGGKTVCDFYLDGKWLPRDGGTGTPQSPKTAPLPAVVDEGVAPQ